MANLQIARTCPRCRSILPDHGFDGICPRCLFLDDPEELTPGTELAGHVIQATLGRGGMGIVYRARHLQLDREVALKVLPAADADFAARFEREARALARLDHEHIVRIYDYGQENDLLYISMQLVDGHSLREEVAHDRLPVDRVRALGLAICRALAAAHEAGVIHRDIKPENVLLGKDGSIKVVDFGIAQLLEAPVSGQRLTVTGTLLGTPHYMAPERIAEPSVAEPRSDLYSVGVLLHEMLTGRLAVGPLAMPGSALDGVLRRALAHDPAQRYDSAEAMAADLQRERGSLEYYEMLWEIGVAILIAIAIVTGGLSVLRYISVLAEQPQSLSPLEYIEQLPFGLIILTAVLAGAALVTYAMLVRHWGRAGLLLAPRPGLEPGGWVVLGLGGTIVALWAVRHLTGMEWMYRYAALYGAVLIMATLFTAALTQMRARRMGRGPLRQWPVWLGLVGSLSAPVIEAVQRLVSSSPG